MFSYTDRDADTDVVGVIRNVGLIDVDASGEVFLGGLVGDNRGVITNCYVTGSVSGEDAVGGLVGDNYGPITDSYVTGSISGDNVIGGLVGRNYDAITASHVTGPVSGAAYIGGLVGNNYGPITASYATGSVSGRTIVGGLVGSHKGAITASYATGSVSGRVQLGGLVGLNHEGAIAASYATGRVSGTGGWVGGLVGLNKGAITASYATGLVSGGENVGGLVGLSNGTGTVTASYWDTHTSGHPTGTHGEGRTTTALQAPMDYSGIYQTWNLDLDGRAGTFQTGNLPLDSDGVADDPWAFGTATQYPVLAVDFDGDGQKTWQEFGYQFREGPTLTATAGGTQVDLSWTAVDASPWTPVPDITYTLTRDDGTTIETLTGGVSDLQYTDTDVTAGTTYTYQVAAVVQSGEATRSATVAVVAGATN